MDETGGSVIDGIFGLLGKKIDQQTAAQQAAATSKATWSGNDPTLAVDEYGRAYLRGAPSSAFTVGSIPPAVLLLGAAGVLVALLFVLKKR
jgi:hypothetical protein